MKTALPHALPYALYVVIGALAANLGTDAAGASWPWVDAVRIAALGALLVWFARRGAYPELFVRPSASAVLLGVAGGVLTQLTWNPLANLATFGETARTGLDPHSGPLFIVLRCVDMIVLVPVLEELLVRDAIPRLADAPPGEDWRLRPIGSFTRLSAAVSVAFFTLTHPEWLSALVTGLVWTVLLAYTRNLRTVVYAHAVANAWLAGYVLVTGESRWW